jgi:hypothetical protein
MNPEHVPITGPLRATIGTTARDPRIVSFRTHKRERSLPNVSANIFGQGSFPRAGSGNFPRHGLGSIPGISVGTLGLAEGTTHAKD